MTHYPITVLNPGGGDKARDFPDFAGKPEAAGHPPVNFHAYAACTGGSFQRSVQIAINLENPVLMLLRGNLKKAGKAVAALKRADLTVAVSLKETGFHQVAGQLDRAGQLARLREIMAMSDGVISPTEALLPFYNALAPDMTDRIVFIPTPYPLDSPDWNFSRPMETRSGLLLGTRELSVISRNHFQALVTAGDLARQTGTRLSIINEDGRRPGRYLDRLGIPGELVNILPRMNYPDYLKTVAGYRLVFQLDMSQVPGQVAGDAALCRVPCIGGNGAVDELVWPEYVGLPRTVLVDRARRLLTDDVFYREATAAAGARADEKISFESVRQELVGFFQYINS